MGGAIAQTLAIKYPESVNKLILANTFIKFIPRSCFMLDYFYRMRSQGMSLVTMFEGSMPWLFSEEVLKDRNQIAKWLNIVEAYPYPQSPIGQKRQLEATVQFNSDPWYQQIKAPTLVIEGSHDITCPVDSQRLAAGISNAQLVSLPGQGHMAHVEQPETFVSAITHFLDQ